MFLIMKIHLQKAKIYITILFLLSMVIARAGNYDITISTSATSNGSWSGGTPDVFTPSGNSANILNTDIQTRLVTKGVTINTSGGGAQTGNITISTTITAAP